MNYPLQLTFKVLAIARQVTVEDARGTLLWSVKQKAIKLKEAITVFADEGQTRPLFEMQADRVLDFSARYEIRTAGSGNVLGTVQRKGMKSLWRAQYQVLRGENVVFEMREENPWVKVADSLLFEIPLVGLLAGYIFHPRYLVSRAGGNTEVLRLEKQAAFMQGKFKIDRLTQLSAEEETLVLLSALMLVLLERQRG